MFYSKTKSHAIFYLSALPVWHGRCDQEEMAVDHQEIWSSVRIGSLTPTKRMTSWQHGLWAHRTGGIPEFKPQHSSGQTAQHTKERLSIKDWISKPWPSNYEPNGALWAQKRSSLSCVEELVFELEINIIYLWILVIICVQQMRGSFLRAGCLLRFRCRKWIERI